LYLFSGGSKKAEIRFSIYLPFLLIRLIGIFVLGYSSACGIKQTHRKRADKLVTRKHLIEVIYQM
jgi:uncharacterized membrane protein